MDELHDHDARTVRGLGFGTGKDWSTKVFFLGHFTLLVGWDGMGWDGMGRDGTELDIGYARGPS